MANLAVSGENNNNNNSPNEWHLLSAPQTGTDDSTLSWVIDQCNEWPLPNATRAAVLALHCGSSPGFPTSARQGPAPRGRAGQTKCHFAGSCFSSDSHEVIFLSPNVPHNSLSALPEWQGRCYIRSGCSAFLTLSSSLHSSSFCSPQEQYWGVQKAINELCISSGYHLDSSLESLQVLIAI